MTSLLYIEILLIGLMGGFIGGIAGTYFYVRHLPRLISKKENYDTGSHKYQEWKSKNK